MTATTAIVPAMIKWYQEVCPVQKSAQFNGLAKPLILNEQETSCAQPQFFPLTESTLTWIRHSNLRSPRQLGESMCVILAGLCDGAGNWISLAAVV